MKILISLKALMEIAISQTALMNMIMILLAQMKIVI
jgi:hypothetical protein